MNDHLKYLTELNQAAAAFWQDWQAQLSRLQNLDAREMVEESNDILRRHLPDVSFELEGDMHNGGSTIVFTANGVLDYFPDVQAVVQAAPVDLPYKIRAFRSAMPEAAENFVIGMDDFQLALKDMVFRLVQWREMPALDIAFTKEIAPEFENHAKNMAFILLDHFIGEWNSAVKIDGVEFVEFAENDFLPMTMLPEKLDVMWRELGRNGAYPEREWQYATAEIDEDDEQDRLLLTRNQSANSLLGRADMTWVISVACELNGQENWDAVYQVEDELAMYSSQNQQGINTLVVTNLSQGVRTVYAVTSEPEVLLPQVLRLAEKYSQLNIEVDCDYDPSWAYYRA